MSWSRLAQSACSSPRNALASACGEEPIRCVGKDGTREERDALGALDLVVWWIGDGDGMGELEGQMGAGVSCLFYISGRSDQSWR
jgi:hypothetical protein